MKGLWTAVILSFLTAIPLSAETVGGWAGYITYTPHNISVKMVVPAPELAWMADQLQHTPMGQPTYLGRHNDQQQVVLEDAMGVWILTIVDPSKMFRLKAQVDPKKGNLVIEQGVDRVGTSRQSDADAAAQQGIDDLRRARTAGSAFSSSMDDDSGMMSSRNMADGIGPWKMLSEGNQRFTSGKVLHPHQSMARLDETRQSVRPFAAVVACSDSRIPPEVLFDQGIGDLYVVRTPAEVLSRIDLGGLEFAVDHDSVAYILVLADKNCDFVNLALKGGDLPPHLDTVAQQLRPAIEAARFFNGDLLDNAVRENALEVVKKLSDTPALAAAIHNGTLVIQAAYYDSDTGKVVRLP